MEQDLKNYIVLAGILGIGLVTGFALNSSGSGSGPGGSLDGSDWRNTTLQDVSTDENFTITGLEKPVVVETFAVWCTTCSRQQSEIKDIHGSVEFSSVSLNVDRNENREKIIQHKETNNFTWTYAISPISLTNQLRERFGNSIANPPSAPVILVCEDGARRIQKEGFGSPVKSSKMLEEEIKLGCNETETNPRSGSGAVS